MIPLGLEGFLRNFYRLFVGLKTTQNNYSLPTCGCFPCQAVIWPEVLLSVQSWDGGPFDLLRRCFSCSSPCRAPPLPEWIIWSFAVPVLFLPQCSSAPGFAVPTSHLTKKLVQNAILHENTRKFPFYTKKKYLY